MNDTMQTALVTILLDRSHSMQKVKGATIEGFNGYLAGLQQEEGATIDFTFLQFDTVSLDKVHVAIPVRTAVLLTEETYKPRGGTPLIDAAVKTIRAVDESLTKRTDTPRVVICLQTDGEENSSVEHTMEELRGLIAEKQAQGWQFNFLGAGIDAYVQGAAMGIAAMGTMSYDHTSAHATRNAFTASAMNAAAYAAGRSDNTEYSLRDRTLSADAFIPMNLTEATPPKGTLDLSNTVRSRKRGTVDDVTL